MKLIPLTGKHGTGKFTMVDDEDYENCIVYTWMGVERKGTAYAENRSIKCQASIHRLIMGVTDPKILIDHIDHDGLNNQRSAEMDTKVPWIVYSHFPVDGSKECQYWITDGNTTVKFQDSCNKYNIGDTVKY